MNNDFYNNYYSHQPSIEDVNESNPGILIRQNERLSDTRPIAERILTQAEEEWVKDFENALYEIYMARQELLIMNFMHYLNEANFGDRPLGLRDLVQHTEVWKWVKASTKISYCLRDGPYVYNYEKANKFILWLVRDLVLNQEDPTMGGSFYVSRVWLNQGDVSWDILWQ